MELQDWKEEAINLIAKIISSRGNCRNADYDRFGKLYEDNAPNVLYKFCGAEYYGNTNYALELIQNDRLWLSDPVKFNDPFDCQVFCTIESIRAETYKHFPTLRQQYEQGSNEQRVRADELIEQFVKKSNTEMNNNQKSARRLNVVSCFCEDNKSLNLWGYYAKCHSGICVEYETEKILRNKILIAPVKYQNELVGVDEFSLYSLLFQMIKSSYYKAEEWEYEREWRIVKNKEEFCKKANDDGVAIPFIEPNAVFLGCNSAQQLTDDVKKVCNCRNIKLFKMEKAINSYSLIPKALSLEDSAEQKKK